LFVRDFLLHPPLAPLMKNERKEKEIKARRKTSYHLWSEMIREGNNKNKERSLLNSVG